MAWQSVVAIRVWTVGMIDCVVSWNPEDWMLSIWFVKHVVVNTLNGQVPEMISFFPPEVASQIWPEFQAKSMLMKLPIDVQAAGYPPATYDSPGGLVAGAQYKDFNWSVTKVGGNPAKPKYGYLAGNPASEAWVNFNYHKAGNPLDPKIPVRYRWGASFCYPPIRFALRMNKALPKPIAALRLGPTGDPIAGKDGNGVKYTISDVSDAYLLAAKDAKGDGNKFPRRVIEVDADGLGQKTSHLLPANFFNPTPKHVWRAFRLGCQLAYEPGGTLLLSDTFPAAPGESKAMYEQALVPIPVFGQV